MKNRKQVTLALNVKRAIGAFAPAALIVFMCSAVVPNAQGGVSITAQEVGGNVVFTGSGTLNLGAWSAFTFNPVSAAPRIEPSDSEVLVGLAASADIYEDPAGAIFPLNFGLGLQSAADSGTGDIFGIRGQPSPQLYVPAGYVSGNSLSGTATYNGETLASLGIDAGSYTWSWGSGGSADSITLTATAVPEPGSFGLLLLGAPVMAVRAYRRRKGRRDSTQTQVSAAAG